MAITKVQEGLKVSYWELVSRTKSGIMTSIYNSWAKNDHLITSNQKDISEYNPTVSPEYLAKNIND